VSSRSIRVIVVPDVQEKCKKNVSKNEEKTLRIVLRRTGAARLQLSVVERRCLKYEEKARESRERKGEKECDSFAAVLRRWPRGRRERQ